MKNEQNNTWDLDKLKLVIRFVNKDYSRYTIFLPLFKFSKSFLRLEEKFSLYLKLKRRLRHYELSKIANLASSLICCGVDRFVRMDDEFRIERGLAKSLGFANKFPTSTTIYRFFRSFNGWNIRQLEKVNLQLLKEQKNKWYPKTGSVFIDLDMNTKSVEGKQFEKATLGYNRKKPGRLFFSWTVTHIAKAALYSELDTGKASGRTVLERQVKHVEKLLEKLDIKNTDKADNRFVWRVDGGYFSWDNLKFLNKRKFLTRLPCNLKIVQPYWKDKKLKWKQYSNSCEYADAGTVMFPDVNDTEFRLILVKVYRKKKVLLYPLCTNVFKWTAKNVVKTYRGRQVVENCFRDTNQAFYSDKLPSGTFHGNQAFLWFIVLAYNQFFFFQKACGRQKIIQANPQKTFPKISQKSRRDKTP